MSDGNVSSGVDFLADGGEMGALMRAHDWASSPLGGPETWPQSLRVTIRLMLNTGHPMFIWWGPELIQFYNDAYRETMGPERHPSALGQKGRDCWEEIWPIIGPQIDYVMAGKGATWNVDQLVPVTRHGSLENVWWTYSYGPIDLDGTVGGVLVVCTDVTQEHLMREAAREHSRRLEQMFEETPSFIAVLRGPEHVFELANAAYRRLVDNSDVIGKPLRDALPEVVEQGFVDLLDTVYRTGKPHVGRRTPVTLRTEDGSTKETFLDFIYQPVFEADGRVSGIFVEGADVTDHVHTEDHLRLLNGELTHRVKNTLAVVSSIARETLRGTGNDPALRAFDERLRTLALAHDLISIDSNASASIHEVVNSALAPHQSSEHRLTVSGPRIRLTSRQAISLALALNELATNAIKYGALSNEAGRILISWRIEPGPDGPAFHFLWQERDGPRVGPPVARGFGSKLIVGVLTADFSADVDLSYRPEGFECRLKASAEMLA